MTTQAQIKKDLETCYGFLKTKANARGFITVRQETLAKELGMTLPKFNRLVHRLAQQGILRIAGGGRQPKTIVLTPVDANGVLILRRDSAGPPERSTAEALRLFDAVCEVVKTIKA